MLADRVGKSTVLLEPLADAMGRHVLSGFEDLCRTWAIRGVACMAHVRRKFVDIHRSQGPPSPREPSAGSPSSTPSRRRPKGHRQFAAPNDEAQKPHGLQRPGAMAGHATDGDPLKIPPRRSHPLGPDPHGAPAPPLDHGILALDGNLAGRGMHAIVFGRNIHPFLGSEADGKACPLIETAKLNAGDPLAWRANTLARLPDCKINKVDDLLPWTSKASRSDQTLAALS
ncbi:transposase domain-containing protein [Stagnihabitans tardus]|uniref:Transposase IS66 C-terminal domain-containing protein n=1 Tax=Stagnihabitans tardus TaxID=2699202 RepID=A0AAE4YAZ0_9RHOB|nr:transposase domain-containing protein [Stagnihabitans tardus]NBZ86310.1 hypothetical protein [Stagnihabitans tardus]